KRTFQDVGVKLAAEGTSLTIERIGAIESDAQVKTRSVAVTGKLDLSDALKPKKVEVAIVADKWLLFGTPTLGKADAPRGTLTIDAKARAELDRPIKVASLDVDKLEVSVPDRFEKAHQPEDVHAGDLVYLDEGKVALGKLAVPDSVREKAEAAKARAAAPDGGTQTGAASASGAAEAQPADGAGTPVESGLDLDISVAKGAKVLMSPLEMHPSGALSVKVRGHERVIRGALTMTGGELSLGGKMHPLTKGSLTFDETHPTGWMDLWFDRPVPPWSLRDISKASGSEAIEIHMFGPLADRRTVLSGAGSPGSLPDLLSMHNGGRERLLSQPDLAETDTVDFPEYGGLLVLSFLSVNLPHLLFLDRVAAWSDPDDDGRAFGHVEHFEGDRYFADGDGRVHAVKRPFTPTRSEAEVEVDYLFVNGPQTLFGVGVSGGSRGGGGPGLVFEWSSRD
ncbi:MAG TPA: translocation/assembly module TamB domain-containing protein, partial [Polyangiaceae bacterium]|nr:translocation/assembly module TamB domain-containing protein [Polyangiaceae bacterium]